MKFVRFYSRQEQVWIKQEQQMAAHVYKTKLTWTGNQGEGTSG